MNTKYDEYLKTEYWGQVAKAVKERAGWKCQMCNRPERLQAHHRTYAHFGCELEHLDDLICLCEVCHSLFHNKAQRHKPEPAPAPKLRDHPGFIKLRRKDIEYCRTSKGGFRMESFELLTGDKWPPMKGWVKRLVGKVIPIERLDRAQRAAR